MGLGLLNTSSISPQKRSDLRNRLLPSVEKSKQYTIENLVLPIETSMSEEREILSIIERLLANKDVATRSYSEKNIIIANALVNNIKERANGHKK